MPVSVVEADELLAEFMLEHEVLKYAPRKRGPKKLVAPKADPFERADYAPQNERIGYQSLGLQSESLVMRMFNNGYSHEIIAKQMVEEYMLGQVGMMRLVPIVSVCLL